MSTKRFAQPCPLITPVLFLIFNRPDTTKQVFEAIRKAKPQKLYIAADGPRDDRPGEDEKCARVRKIATAVDWDCEVKTLFRKINFGCKIAISSSIDWFFENVEEGIILEDDCLPSQSFFWFCQELLETYRNDTRVMSIGGNNKGLSFSKPHSYFFSKYVQIWGWATWKKSWEKYDYKIEKWATVKEEISNYIYSRKEIKIRIKQFDSVYNNKLDTWDFQWNFICLIHNGLSVLPSLNLISNIGFTDDATHTTMKRNKLNNLNRYEIKFPLYAPDYIIFNNKFEETHQQNNQFEGVLLICITLLERGLKKIKNYFGY